MLPPEPDSELPAVDERLVAPETRYEIIDGRVVYVSPSDEPHGVRHSALGALLLAHRDAAFNVALDMLTRTSRIGDMAPDASIYPAARDPVTGGRQLEQLAFEIVSTQSLGEAGIKAARLVGRGVRRVFAIDVDHQTALEWSPALGQWSILDRRSVIEDPVLAIALPVDVLVDTTRSDDAVVRAFRLKRHPEFLAEREEGRADGVVEGSLAATAKAVEIVLAARGLAPTQVQRDRIATERDSHRLDRWVAGAATCHSVDELLSIE